MIELARPKTGDKMADLGSGDGRILVAFGKKGIESHGYELDSQLIEKSQNEIEKENLNDRVFVQIEDFWDVDLSSFDIITIYPMPDLIGILEEKLRKELHPATRVLLNYYSFSTKIPKAIKNNIYLYQFD